MTSIRPSPRIHIVATGGTFEKVYDPATERMTFAAPSSIPAILEAAGITDVALHQPMQVDSAHMDEATRRHLLDFVRGLGDERFVIVHGTSTMVETARLFRRELTAGLCIFTGAMVPFAYAPVEASFNLGGALALAGVLERGVYVHMHGALLDPAAIEKDVALARFVPHA